MAPGRHSRAASHALRACGLILANLRLAIDEDFDHDIVRGLIRRNTEADILTIQEAGKRGLPDSEALDWAAAEGPILLTHDAKTMASHAYARLRAGLSMPGVMVIPQSVPVGDAIRGLESLQAASSMDDWDGRVAYLSA